MHDTANNKPGRSTAGKMQSRSFLHSQVSFQSPLCKEICGQLYGTAKSSPHHSGANSAVQTLDTLVCINLAHPINGILVLMLSSDRQERRVGLQTGLHKEERGARGGSQYTGACPAEDIDS